MSKFLSNRALTGLIRMGDVMLPQNGEFPAYSAFGGYEHIDDLLEYVPEADRKDLNLVLVSISFLPNGLLNWLVKNIMNSFGTGNGAIAVVYRQLNFALRGLLFSTYYTEKSGAKFSGIRPIDICGYQINRI
ncbi:MAG: hypothetical protein LC115_06185 [Bacteroidia bacterium]|nr:hypothetical protein [Bacteroidia bacterium]